MIIINGKNCMKICYCWWVRIMIHLQALQYANLILDVDSFFHAQIGLRGLRHIFNVYAKRNKRDYTIRIRRRVFSGGQNNNIWFSTVQIFCQISISNNCISFKFSIFYFIRTYLILHYHFFFC